MKLTFKATYTFTTQDMGETGANPIIEFEAHARRPDGWTQLMLEFIRGENTDQIDHDRQAARALELVGLCIVSVSQGGERFPLNGVEGAEALRDAIEADNPGYGDLFIRHVAWAYYDLLTKREDAALGNSARPLPQSGDGNSRKKSKSPAKS